MTKAVAYHGPYAHEPRRRPITRLLEGHRIVKVEMNPFLSRGVKAYDPVLILENGARIRFLVQETEGGYGVDILYADPE